MPNMRLRKLAMAVIAVGVASVVIATLLIRAVRLSPPTLTDGEFPMPAGPVHFHAEFYGNSYQFDGTGPNRIGSAQPYLDLCERWRSAKSIAELESLCTPECFAYEHRDPTFEKTIENRKSLMPPKPHISIYLTIETDSPEGKRMYIAFAYNRQSWDTMRCNVHIIRLEPGGAKMDNRHEIDALDSALQRGHWKQFGAPRDLNWY
jgi:hypothetical protein